VQNFILKISRQKITCQIENRVLVKAILIKDVVVLSSGIDTVQSNRYPRFLHLAGCLLLRALRP
jgi:hypothetical protein